MTPAVGLQGIVDAAEEEWSVRRVDTGIELLKLDGAGRLLASDAINSGTEGIAHPELTWRDEQL